MFVVKCSGLTLCARLASDGLYGLAGWMLTGDAAKPDPF
jgi:hypothetical protein